MSMPGETRRKRRVAGVLMAGLALFLASCGTLLYPERRGQPTGRLDPGVVVLDGIGLLLFFIPGVIAFVVDFSTGAIYLPPDHYELVPIAGADLRKVGIDPAQLTPQRVEAVVYEQTGKKVTLQPGEYRAMRLQTLDEFTIQTLPGLQANSQTAKVIFRANDE